MIYIKNAYILCCVIAAVLALVLLFIILLICHGIRYDYDVQILLYSCYVRIFFTARNAWLIIVLGQVFIPYSFEYNYFLLSEFSSDLILINDYHIPLNFTNLLFNLLPVAYAEEIQGNIAISNVLLQSLEGEGGSLVRQLYHNVYLQFSKDIPINLTANGVKASVVLTDMLNCLHSSSFKGDSALFEYLGKSTNSSFKVNFDVGSTKIDPLQVYSLPLGNNPLVGHDSGVYGFFLSNPDQTDVGLGSAISCRSRLIDHMNSFKDRRTQQYLHQYVMSHGGLDNLTWAPLITTDNLVHNWNINHFSQELSLGASKVLQGFSQYPIRLLEQGMMDKYLPTLNPGQNNVIFFNFAFSSSEFSKSLGSTNVYQAFDSTMTKVLAESDSYNKLGKFIGLSNVAVRNNMDWHLGTHFTINGQEVHGYLREAGQPLRTESSLTQLSPKAKGSMVELLGRTLHDLTPGKIYAITIDSLEDFGTYDNERHLWTSLNPSQVDHVQSLSSKEGKQYLNNRVGRYMNLHREGGNPTESGNFHFCRHPDFLAGLAKVAQALFVVNIITGVSTLYPNISKVSSNRTTIRSHLNKGTIHNFTYRYIYESDFVKQFPRAKGQSSIKLTEDEVDSIYNMPSPSK